MRYFLATKIYIRNFSDQILFSRQLTFYIQIDSIFTKLSYISLLNLKIEQNLTILFYLYENSKTNRSKMS